MLAETIVVIGFGLAGVMLGIIVYTLAGRVEKLESLGVRICGKCARVFSGYVSTVNDPMPTLCNDCACKKKADTVILHWAKGHIEAVEALMKEAEAKRDVDYTYITPNGGWVSMKTTEIVDPKPRKTRKTRRKPRHTKG